MARILFVILIGVLRENFSRKEDGGPPRLMVHGTESLFCNGVVRENFSPRRGAPPIPWRMGLI